MIRLFKKKGINKQQENLLEINSNKIQTASQLITESQIKSQESEINQIQQEITNQQNSLNTKLSLHSLQKHLQLLKLEEYLIMVTFISLAILGRILLQGFPSIEPITFFTILAGSILGWRKGLATGISSWYLSNFFMFGGQGPWTIIHIANGALAGLLAGIFLYKKTTLPKVITITLISTLLFEISINTMSGLLFFGLFASFISAIPFTITHIISNTILSLAIPKAKKEITEKGKLNQKELSEKYIKKLQNLYKQNKTSSINEL
jgi:uncharacterized membrane protein|tara:strand:+ start:1615 stop:2406 length:792 start_codon:yes stop_codon:yes gene_type:complete